MRAPALGHIVSGMGWCSTQHIARGRTCSPRSSPALPESREAAGARTTLGPAFERGSGRRTHCDWLDYPPGSPVYQGCMVPGKIISSSLSRSRLTRGYPMGSCKTTDSLFLREDCAVSLSFWLTRAKDPSYAIFSSRHQTLTCVAEPPAAPQARYNLAESAAGSEDRVCSRRNGRLGPYPTDASPAKGCGHPSTPEFAGPE